MITLIHLTNILVLFIKIHIYRNKIIQSVYSECVFIDDYLFDTIRANTAKVELQLNYTSLNNFQNFGIGLWIKYLPFLNDKNQIKFERRYFKNENENLIQKSNGEQFVMLINNKQNKDIESILQMTRNPLTGCFEYLLSQNIQDQRQEFIFSFSQNSFEGEWLMFYQYFDFIETKTHVTFWHTKNNVQEFKIIKNIPNFKRIIEIQYGGFEIIGKIQGNQIDVQRFQGAISPPFLTFYQLFGQNDFQLCLDLLNFYTECRMQNITSIQFETIYLNNTYIQIASRYSIQHTLQNFYLNGWVKLDQLQNSKKQTLILRVSLSSNYNDDSYIGDKFFYLVYYQNMIQNLNGFELTTYSYEEPIYTQYTPKESDKIQDYNPQYEDRFTQWHMFQFQRDQSKNDGQPIFQFYFPKTGYQFFYFNQKINYFSSVKLYFSVGGDKYTKEYMFGYISQFFFYSVCGEFDLYLKINCHYSCLTCYGPNENNCLSCPEESYREYVLETQQCICQIGYVDLMFTNCFSLLNNESGVNMIEHDLRKLYPYQLICQFGFFTFQNQCIQCPYYDDLKSRLKIQCANCYLNPLEFSQLLRCTINLISFDNDKENTYQIQELEESDVINFIIVKDLMDQYQIKQSEYGQYVYNQNFKDCSINCQVCVDENIFQNVFKIMKLMIQDNNINCSIGQYSFNNQCLSCGQYCQQCDRFGLCQYCIDSKINYISFDGINCNNCTISNCQYCFDFFYQENQIHLTLDNQFIFTKSNQVQIFQGCAQCQNDYFFNFNNLKCEDKCSHLTNNDQIIECLKKYKNCYFGIINYNQDIICIKSIDSIDSIQNQNCGQIDYCQECIISQNIVYCSQCLIGYYLDIYSGQCILCNENCSSCVMQNKLFKDEWKQELIAFSYYFINKDIQSFLGINRYDHSNYQLICKSCFNGYLLYENKCLKGCDSQCENCQIINGSPMCKKCVLTKFGYKRAISKDGVCLECSKMCSLCVERTPDEIFNYNPYFIMKESNMIYTRKCLELFTENDGSNFYYIQPQQNFVMICENNINCIKQFYLNIRLYSSESDYFNNYDEGFGLPLSKFFIYQNLQIDQQFYQLMNQLSAQELTIQFILVQGNSSFCLIEKNSWFSQNFTQDIFSLQNVHLKFIGFSINTLLVLEQNFELYNFTSVSFINITFLLDQNIMQQNSVILIETFSNKTQLNFDNCSIINQGDNQNYSLSFQVNKPYNLLIKYFKLDSITYINTTLFNIYLEDAIIYIENFQIIQSLFQNSFLFYIQDYQKVEQSQFTNSSLFNFNTNLQILSIVNQKIYVKQCEFIKNSFIFYIPTLLNLKITDLFIQNTNFQDNCVAFLSFNIDFDQCSFSNINLQSSQLISNQYQKEYQNKDLILIDIISIRNCEFQNIYLEYPLPVIQIINYNYLNNLIFLLENVSITNVSSNLRQDQQNQNFNYSNVILKFNCYICKLNNILIERDNGIIELMIINSHSISISEVNVNQLNKFVMKNQTDNVDNSALSVMIIQKYQNIEFQDFHINNCQTQNSPLIYLEGYKLSQKQVRETVNIMNSIFKNNQFTLSQQNSFVSIIYIKSEQNIYLKLNKLIFENNVLTSKIKFSNYHNSATLVLVAQLGEIEYIDGNFIKNNAINTFDSILFIQAQSIILENILFFKNNQQSQINYSNGGNGQFITMNLTLNNISSFYSSGSLGGGFYVYTDSVGQVLIKYCHFSNTETTVNNSFQSKGGILYIDSSVSQLNLQIIDTVFSNSISRQDGGGIYIKLSQLSNLIQFNNIIVQDCFSQNSQFLAFNLEQITQTEPQIYFENSTFNQTINGFQTFIQKIKEGSQLNVANQKVLINFIQNKIILKNVKFQNFFYSTLLFINIGSEILLSNVKISDCIYSTTPMIIIQFNTLIPSNLKFLNFIMQNIQQNIDGLNFLNQQTINSLIQITSITKKHQILFRNVEFKQINCNICRNGVLNLNVVEQSQKLNIKLQQLTILNNFCGLQGCLSIIQVFQNQQRTLFVNDEKLLNQYNISLLISESTFINNTGQYGGALFISSNQAMLYNCKFLYNQANLGGAIYYQTSNQLLIIYNSIIVQNSAQIGGGIFLEQSQISNMKQLKIFIQNNNSTNFGNDISENPTSLTVSLDGGQTFLEKKYVINTDKEINEIIMVQPYKILGQKQLQAYITLPSGIPINKYSYFDLYSQKFINYNLTFRIIALNNIFTQEKLLKNAYCTLKHQIINKINQKQNQNIKGALSKTNVSFDYVNGYFNLDDLIISFNPYNSIDYFMRIIVQCNVIQIPIMKIQNNSQTIEFISNYSLYVDIETFQCQIGEIFNPQTGDCIECDTQKNLYQVIKNATFCIYKDDNMIDQFTRSTIQLKQNYWRSNSSSTQIEICFNLKENCLGGWFPGDQSCFIGHIGALCEQCDIYNIRGDGQYSNNLFYTCSFCANNKINILFILLVFIWTLISIQLSVNSTNDTIMKRILFGKIQRIKFSQEISAAMLIKLFMNYLQIVSTIQSFQIKVPNIISYIYNSIGQPNQQLLYSLDCFLVELSTIDINYFRVIWIIIMALLQISIYSLIQMVKSKLEKKQLQYYFIKITILYVFISNQPSLISNLISQLSFRTISDIKWVQGNVAYKYETTNHQQWILYLILPKTILLGLFLPILMFMGMYSVRNQLNKITNQRNWGYLIGEYKPKYYFWDIVKLFQKEIIILVLTYYHDYVAVKGSIVVLMLLCYSHLQVIFQPYLSKQLNILEDEVTKICSYTIILSTCIFQAQENNVQEIKWSAYVIIIYFNLSQFLKFVWKIVKVNFQQIDLMFDQQKKTIIQYFPMVLQLHPVFRKLFSSKLDRSQRVKKKFEIIRLKIIPDIRDNISYNNSLLLNIKQRSIYLRNKMTLMTEEYQPNSTERMQQQQEMSLLQILTNKSSKTIDQYKQQLFFKLQRQVKSKKY